MAVGCEVKVRMRSRGRLSASRVDGLLADHGCAHFVMLLSISNDFRLRS